MFTFNFHRVQGPLPFWLYSISKQLGTENVWFSVWKAYWCLWHSWSHLGKRKKVPDSRDLDMHLDTCTHWWKWKFKSSGLKNWEIWIETFIPLAIYVWEVLAWMYEVLARHTVTCYPISTTISVWTSYYTQWPYFCWSAVEDWLYPTVCLILNNSDFPPALHTQPAEARCNVTTQIFQFSKIHFAKSSLCIWTTVYLCLATSGKQALIYYNVYHARWQYVFNVTCRMK